MRLTASNPNSYELHHSIKINQKRQFHMFEFPYRK